MLVKGTAGLGSTLFIWAESDVLEVADPRRASSGGEGAGSLESPHTGSVARQSAAEVLPLLC